MEKLWSSSEISNEERIDVVQDSMSYLGKLIKENISEDFIYVAANKFNWTGQSGYKIISNWDKSPLELSKEIMPDYLNTLDLYKENGKLLVVVGGHDIPTGATWYLHGLVDTEEIMEDIIHQSIHGFNLLEEFTSDVEERLKFNFSNWFEEDVTSEHQDLEEGDKVVILKPEKSRSYVEFKVFLNEEGIIEDVEYCSDQLERYYISDILSL